MSLFADVVLIVHFAFVLFIIGGLLAIWVGALASWDWTRNFWFRALHLAAICFVTAEAVLGLACPLTIWENALRGVGNERSFVGRWVHRLLFYDLPESVFTTAYVIFAFAVILTYWRLPPLSRHEMHERRS
jgi:hypothetical protein